MFNIAETAMVRALGFAKIPLLFYLSPVVIEVNDRTAAIKIPLGYRSKNHLNSMYFGALCAGADLAGGIYAFSLLRKQFKGVQLVFKDFKAEFLKRADGDVVFRNDDSPAILDAMRKTWETGERVTIPVNVVATVPSKYGTEPVARFTLGLSLKRK